MKHDTPIAKNLRVLLAEKGWRASYLSKVSGVRNATISNTCKSKTSPRLSTLEKLAKALGVPLERLVQG